MKDADPKIVEASKQSSMAKIVEALGRANSRRECDFDDRMTVVRRFDSKDGTRYAITRCGMIVRRDPKPWHGKSERREVLRVRREERELRQRNEAVAVQSTGIRTPAGVAKPGKHGNPTGQTRRGFHPVGGF